MMKIYNQAVYSYYWATDILICSLKWFPKFLFVQIFETKLKPNYPLNWFIGATGSLKIQSLIPTNSWIGRIFKYLRFCVSQVFEIRPIMDPVSHNPTLGFALTRKLINGQSPTNNTIDFFTRAG